jgi:Uma2 family endonuclease
VILAEDTAVAPDVVWVSAARLPLLLAADGKLHGAPDLAIEILSPGEATERRDRQTKLDDYWQYGVGEHWIVDWRRRVVQDMLALGQTLQADDRIASPLLPGLAVPVKALFPDFPMPTGD